jgi:hypothetical protein
MHLEAGTEIEEKIIAPGLADLSRIDLTPVRSRITRENSSLTVDQICDMERRYLQFLLRCKQEPDIRHEPDKEVDLYWHTHILQTRKYLADCQKYLGYFLHHEPNLIAEGCNSGCGNIQV